MSTTGDLNRRALDRMHKVLSAEMWMMWVISRWYSRGDVNNAHMRAVLVWARDRYLGGTL